MLSSLTLLETARRALSVHQRALDTVGHNVANASTPGYSRQEVMMAPTAPLTAGPGILIGTGVRVVEVRRHSDAFIDAQIRSHQAQLSSHLSLQQAVSQVEMLLGEPSSTGIMACLERFWVCLSELAQHPDSISARALVRESASTLTTALAGVARDLRDLLQDIEESIRAQVADANTLIANISDLNHQIMAARGRGHATSDLDDARDLLLDRLAALVGARVGLGSQGEVRASVGGIPVVQAEVGQQLLVVRQPDGSPALGREGLDGLVEPGGSIGGLLDRAWCLVSQTIGKLDTLALAIADGVNAVHADGHGLDGSTGLAFFAIGEGAHTLRLSPEIAGGDAGLRAIAAGLTSAPGDGDNARRLAGLKETLVVGGFPGWDGYWRHVIADLGVTGSEVNRAVQTGRLMVKELENRRDAVRGVSIDEEITNLVRYQHAYAAAARLATAADEMLETVVNRLGLVGR